MKPLGLILFHISHSQYDGCWWPGDLSCQGIISHGINLILPEYSSFSIKTVKSKACMLSISQTLVMTCYSCHGKSSWTVQHELWPTTFMAHHSNQFYGQTCIIIKGFNLLVNEFLSLRKMVTKGCSQDLTYPEHSKFQKFSCLNLIDWLIDWLAKFYLMLFPFRKAITWTNVNLSLHIKFETKWLSLCRHFQIHFLEWKGFKFLLKFNQDVFLRVPLTINQHLLR